jgi:hypothetical protein
MNIKVLDMEVRERAFAGGITLSHLKFEKSIFDHVASTFDPSVIRVLVGEITLTTSTTATEATYEDLCKFAENKPGDILIWGSMSTVNYKEVINFRENKALPDENQSNINSMEKQDMLGMILCAYIMHGTLKRLEGKKSLVPKFALEATNSGTRHFKGEDFSSSKSFFSAKFPGIPMAFFSIFNQLPMTLQSRLRLGIAGNRIVSIAAKIYEECGKPIITQPWLKVLLEKKTQDNAPYVSFHPDHPDNPMKECSQKAYAILGDMLRKKGIEVDILAERMPKVFISGVVERLKARSIDVSEKEPEEASVTKAVSADFSVRQFKS